MLHFKYELLCEPKIKFKNLKENLNYLCSLISESHTRHQTFWMVYVVRVAYLTQVSVVIVQRPNVKRQTIWFHETHYVTDVLSCCVAFYDHVIS